jgi:uncharacterized protein YjbJ (UPF0337 family)
VNKDQVQGKWEQLKGSAKKAWGELTDDDFKKAEGDADKLYGVIQERFGDSKESIMKKINAIHSK